MPSFPSSEPTVSYFDDFDYFKDFKKEFPAIAYNDALTSELDFSHEPTVSPQHIDEFDETSLSECDDKGQNVIHCNDLFPFSIIYLDDLSDKDNDNDKIDIEHSSGNLSIEPLSNESIRRILGIDDFNMTMEEYIMFEEEKARRRGQVFNWQTATYGKIRVDDDPHDLSSVEAEFPAIIIYDAFAPQDVL
ncbi:hypothetical protein Tco_0137654 [Tanacetum coccineum]